MPQTIVLDSDKDSESGLSQDYRAEARRIYKAINEHLVILGGEEALSVSKLSEQLRSLLSKGHISTFTLSEKIDKNVSPQQ